MAWTILALRRLRDDLAPTLGLLVLLLATSVLAAIAPRGLAALGNDAVQSEIAGQPPAARSIVLQQHRTIMAGPDGNPLGGVRAAGEALRATFPARVRKLIASSDEIVDSGRFRIEKATTDPAFLRLRVQPGIETHLRYTAGAAPGATVGSQDGVGPELVDQVPVFEASVSEATAARFGIALGETLQLKGDTGDPLIGRGDRPYYLLVRITGIYTVTDPAADYWLDDPLAIHPVIRALSSEVQLLDAVVVVDPDIYAALLATADSTGRKLRVTWRSFTDTSRLTEAAVPDLITAFRRLEVQYPSANVTASQDTALRTGFLDILAAHRASWVAAESIVAVTALGPVLVGISTLALIAILAARRRRSTMALARSRGATGRGVIVPTLLESLLLAAPAAFVGVVVATGLIHAGSRTATIAAAAAVVVTATALIVGTVVPVARALGPERRVGARAVGRPGGRRLVFEGLVVVLAVAGAWILRDRGLHAGTVAGGTPELDPLTAAVPALVGIAAGLVAVRVYPLLMRGAAWAARRRRGLVPMLAARRATESSGTTAVLLVLLATATVGSFAAASLAAIDTGADLGAWQAIGGDYRLDVPSGALPNGLSPATLPGVETAATEFRAAIPLGLSGPQTLFIAVEAAKLEQVLAGTPMAPAYPAGFTEPGEGPIPAIVSRRLVDNPRGVQPGETFQFSVEGYTLTYRADMVVDAWPDVAADRAFVVIPREWFLHQAPRARIVPVTAVLRAPAAAAPTIREAVNAISPVVSVRSRYEDVAARRTAPVTEAVRAMIAAAALVTLAYAALGVAAALALAGVARTVETAHLRTLGLTGRQALALLVAEHAPVTLAAFLAGGALGVALLVVLRPALGLGALVGAPADVPLVIDGVALLVILAAMAAVVGAGLVLGAILQRRVAPTAALRGRFE